MQQLLWVIYQKKRSLGLDFGAHFLHDFSIKMFFVNSLSMGNVSMSYLFSFSRYQTKCVIKFLFRQLMTSQTLRFILDRAVKQWLTGKKERERWKYKN